MSGAKAAGRAAPRPRPAAESGGGGAGRRRLFRALVLASRGAPLFLGPQAAVRRARAAPRALLFMYWARVNNTLFFKSCWNARARCARRRRRNATYTPTHTLLLLLTPAPPTIHPPQMPSPFPAFFVLGGLARAGRGWRAPPSLSAPLRLPPTPGRARACARSLFLGRSSPPQLPPRPPRPGQNFVTRCHPFVAAEARP